MTFTDEDLEKLFQASIDQGKRGGTVNVYPERLQALIIRLEAAEACIPHVYANRERFRALEKWRKAAGK